MKIVNSFESFFLENVDQNNFVRHRKAKMILYLHTSFIIGLFIMSISALNASPERMKTVASK